MNPSHYRHAGPVAVLMMTILILTGCGGGGGNDESGANPSPGTTSPAGPPASPDPVVFSITATAEPADGGSISGARDYNEGETVTLTAMPNTGYTFVNWTENGSQVSAVASLTFTADADRELVANFAAKTAVDENTPFEVAAFGYEDSRPESFHPLLRGRSALVKSEELVVLPASMTGFIEDDKEEMNPSFNLSPGLSGAAAFYKSAGHADVDGDGREEMVILRDDNGLILEVYSVYLGRDPRLRATIDDGGDMLVSRMVPGDLDGDGADELIQYGVTGEDADNITSSRISVYRFNGSGYNRIGKLIFPPMVDIAVDTGDFDGDGRDELLTVYRNASSGGIAAFIYDDATERFAVITGTDLATDWLDDGNYAVLELGAVAADVDGDGRPEAVAAAIRRDNNSGTGEIVLRALSLQNGSLTTVTEASQGLQGTAHSPYDDEFWILARADLNGDGQDEVVSTLRDFNGPEYACRFDLIALNNDTAPQPFDTPGEVIFVDGIGASNKSRCAMAVVDNDRDGADEVIMGRLDPAPELSDPNNLSRREIHAAFECVASDQNGNCVKSAYVVKKSLLPVKDVGRGYKNPPPMAFLGADFDGDNLGVRYTGNKWQSLPNPMVLFVVAAPPTEAGISQNYTLTGTNIALSESAGESRGAAYGTTVGVTLSAESPGFLFADMLTFEASVSLERAVTRSNINTKIETREEIFEGGSDLDRVIFQGTLFTSYEYEIVAAPDPDLIGTRITIDEPVDTKIYDWSLDFFNASVDSTQQIGPDILSHKPGDVSSYMSESQKNAFQGAKGFLQTEETPVSQGDGVRSTAIEITEENVSQVEVTQSVEYATGFTVAGQGMTVSQGLSDTSIYSINLSESIRYEASVGAIREAQEYNDYRYDFGMFVRWVERSDGAKFQVIDYWVDNLGPAH